MTTYPRPVALSTSPPTENVRSIARRLGVSEASLRAYLEAHGGAPDGMGRPDTVVAVRVDAILISRALPEHASSRTPPRVKRDGARYFMPD